MNDVRKRFEKIILNHEIPFVEQVQQKEVWNFLASMHDQIAIMKGYDQNNLYHCYDLLTHTAYVVDGIHYDELYEKDYYDLRIAAFFHDIGKPLVRADKIIKGHVFNSFHGHPMVSEQVATKILKDIGYTSAELRRIRFFILAHDLFIDFKLPEEYEGNPEKHRHSILPKNIKRVIERTKRDYPDLKITLDDFDTLMILCYADALAHSEIVYDGDGNIKTTAKQMAELPIRTQQCIQELKKQETQ